MPKWNPVKAGGVEYSLDHLDDFTMVVKDSAGVERSVWVTFSDHCFTTDVCTGKEPPEFNLGKRRNSQKTAYFCPERHKASLLLPGFLMNFKEMWHSDRDDGFALFRRYKVGDEYQVYSIYFTLHPSKSQDADFILQVESAYIRLRPSATFGPEKCGEVLALLQRGIKPRRNTSARRLRPSLP